MLISDNKRKTETKIYSGNSTNNKSKFLNFFIERYSEAYKLQLNDLYNLVKTLKSKMRYFDCLVNNASLFENDKLDNFNSKS